jgi:hypothetical protein
MPIHEADPWRLQYFSYIETDVNITTEDSDAWQWYPAHRWVYNKLAVAHSQGLEAGPHGTRPPRFPIFSKPIVNLKAWALEAVCSDRRLITTLMRRLANSGCGS